MREVQACPFRLHLTLQLIDSDRVSWNNADPSCGSLTTFDRPTQDQERGKYVRILEELLSVPEVDDLLDPGFLPKELAQRLRVTGLHPLVGDHEREPAAGFEDLGSPLIEVYVQVSHAVEGLVVPLKIGLDRAQQFLSHVRRVPHDRIKSAPLEDAWKLGLPVEGIGVDRRVVHHAVAAADVSG